MQKKNSKPEVDWRSVNRKCTEALEWDDVLAKFEGERIDFRLSDNIADIADYGNRNQNLRRSTGSRLHLRHGMRYRRNSNGYTHIFDTSRLNGNVSGVILHFRTSGTQS